jgi:hypothetical protein
MHSIKNYILFGTAIAILKAQLIFKTVQDFKKDLRWIK